MFARRRYPKIFQMVWRMMRGFTQNFSAGFFIEAVTDVHSRLCLAEI